MENEKHSKIYCKKCGVDWGVMMRVNGIDFAVIKVENFKFDLNGKIIIPKKWKDFPFEILDESIYSLSGITDLTGLETLAAFLLLLLFVFSISPNASLIGLRVLPSPCY